jgi:replication-associated recombination protein RarA
LRPKQVKQILEKVVEKPLEAAPVMEWGPPGIGKSAIPKQVALENRLGEQGEVVTAYVPAHRQVLPHLQEPCP